MNETNLKIIYNENNFESITIPYKNISYISLSDIQIRILVRDITATSYAIIIRKKVDFPSDDAYFEKIDEILKDVSSNSNVGIFNIANLGELVSESDKSSENYDNYFIYRKSDLNIIKSTVDTYNDGQHNHSGTNCLNAISIIYMNKKIEWLIPVWNSQYYDPFVKCIGNTLNSGATQWWDN